MSIQHNLPAAGESVAPHVAAILEAQPRFDMWSMNDLERFSKQAVNKVAAGRALDRVHKHLLNRTPLSEARSLSEFLEARMFPPVQAHGSAPHEEGTYCEVAVWQREWLLNVFTAAHNIESAFIDKRPEPKQVQALIDAYVNALSMPSVNVG